MAKRKRYRLKNADKSKVAGDYVLAILVLMLVAFGIMMVFSASYYWALRNDGSAYTYLVKDGIFALIGLVIFLFLASFDYHRLAHLAVPVLIASMVLLGILIPFGKDLKLPRWVGYAIYPAHLLLLYGLEQIVK